MAFMLKLEIVTPDAIVYSEDVHMVTLPAIEGQIGVYPQHIPLMTQIVPGEIIVQKDGHESYLAVGEGALWIGRAGGETTASSPPTRASERSAQIATLTSGPTPSVSRWRDTAPARRCNSA